MSLENQSFLGCTAAGIAELFYSIPLYIANEIQSYTSNYWLKLVVATISFITNSIPVTYKGNIYM